MSETSAPPLEGYTIYDPTDPFESRAGPFYCKRRDDGSHHFVLRATEHHANRQGVVHGGLLLTMIDLTFAATAKQTPDQRLATISLASEFAAAGRIGTLIEADAEIVRRTNTLCFLRGQVVSEGEVLLNASCIYRLFRTRG